MQSTSNQWEKKLKESFEKKGYWKPLTLGEHLKIWADKFGSRTAIAEKNRSITYEELDILADHFAAGLIDQGIKKNDTVIVQLPNSINFVVSVFALFRVGAIPIMCMMANGENDIDSFCSMAKPKAYITINTFLGFDYLSKAEKIKEKHESIKLLITDQTTENSLGIDSLLVSSSRIKTSPYYKDIALLQLSGGTTGTSKLIPRTHTDHTFNFESASEFLKINKDSVYLAVLPIAHNFALACPGVFGILSCGGKVVMAETPGCEEAFALIEKEKVTITSLVPPLVNLWLQAKRTDDTDISSLEILQVGGSRFEEASARQVEPVLGCKLQQVFGMTEGFFSYTDINGDIETIVKTQGKPLCPDDEFRIIDENGNDVETGKSGELIVRSPCTIFNYYGDYKQNKHSFSHNGYFYHSGDKVRVTPQGNLVVEGRIKDLIIRGGENIPCAEVEFHISAHPGVEDASIVGIPDELLGEKSCAFIIGNDQKPGLLELRTFLKDRGLPNYKIPDQLEVIDNWPLTNIGKIDKRVLKNKTYKKQTKKPSLHEKIQYNDYILDIKGDPLIISGFLAESDFTENYFIYENKESWDIALGVEASITITAEKTILEYQGEKTDFQSDSLSSSITKALNSLPIKDWRVYGTSNFEIACYKYEMHDIDKTEPLMHLIIPKHEVRIKKDSILVRSLEKNKLYELTDLIETIKHFCLSENKDYFDIKINVNRFDLTEIEIENIDSYQKAVTTAMDEIKDRKYNKITLSRQINLPNELDMVASYISGRRANTPERSFLFKINDLQSIGFSPETVLRVDENKIVKTRPLAGTRAMGSSIKEEKELEEELLTDFKEIYEHAMTVHMAYKELSEICEAGSVGISDFMSICKRGSVQHLGSLVKGKLSEDLNVWDAFTTLVPALTVTGGPKTESIAAIRRIESALPPRGLYGGCVFIAESTGAMDVALVLRAAFQKNQKAWTRTGAGIVDISNPEREAEETCEKIRSISQHLVRV